jgi:hypothetical protein
MNRTKARCVTTNAEIDAAIARAKEYEPYRPVVTAAEYRPASDMISLRFRTGVQLSIPRKLLQGLESAKVSDLRRIEVTLQGSALSWPTLDVDHYVPGLMEGVFGNRRWMSAIGKKGGAARSAAKARAARKNGRKGGRPRRNAAA